MKPYPIRACGGLPDLKLGFLSEAPSKGSKFQVLPTYTHSYSLEELALKHKCICLFIQVKEVNTYQAEETYQLLGNTTRALILTFGKHPRYMRKANSMQEKQQQKEME